MEKNKILKLGIIVAGAIVYALPKLAPDFDPVSVGSFLGAFLAPVIISLVIAALIDSIRTLLIKSYKFNNFLNVWFYTYIPVILLALSTIIFPL